MKYENLKDAISQLEMPNYQTDVSGSAYVDLFGNKIIKDELLRDKFIEPLLYAIIWQYYNIKN